jgi:hypothetical protein
LLPLVPADRVLPPGVLAERQWVKFDPAPGFTVFEATKIANVRSIGGSNASFHGDWSTSQAWADALWQHPAKIDGILYRSDKNTPRVCVGLFRRSSRALISQIKATAAGALGDDTAFLNAMRRKSHLA